MKKAAQQLDTLPCAYGTIGFRYCRYDIYMKPQSNHLLLYTVDEEMQNVTVFNEE